MNFSQRYGYSRAKQAIQMESMDSDLRNSLWNAVDIYYWKPLARDIGLSDYENPRLYQICLRLWVKFFKSPLDTLPTNWGDTRYLLRKNYFEREWFYVYDFTEFIYQNDGNEERREAFARTVNDFLRAEVAGYRLIGGQIAPITDDVEIVEIDEAIVEANGSVSDQLTTALELLSDRNNPDYRNSVKESISAVEGQLISSLGKSGGTLGSLLNQLDAQTPLHPALKEAFSKLYGYTSDEGGIRHALLDDSRQVTFEEAKFMLVACSAFVNYVRGTAKS